MIAGTIALIGIVVGLYFQILPERNVIIRFSEIGFFSLCIPVLIGEVWQRLRTVKCSLQNLKIFLGVSSTGLLVLLYQAFQDGGILTFEFLAVVSLTIVIIVLVAVGAEPINKLFSNAKPVKKI